MGTVASVAVGIKGFLEENLKSSFEEVVKREKEFVLPFKEPTFSLGHDLRDSKAPVISIGEEMVKHRAEEFGESRFDAASRCDVAILIVSTASALKADEKNKSWKGRLRDTDLLSRYLFAYASAINHAVATKGIRGDDIEGIQFFDIGEIFTAPTVVKKTDLIRWVLVDLCVHA